MIKNNKGILFWITGFSGSGKTQMAKKIHSQIIKIIVQPSYLVVMT